MLEQWHFILLILNKINYLDWIFNMLIDLTVINASDYIKKSLIINLWVGLKLSLIGQPLDMI